MPDSFYVPKLKHVAPIVGSPMESITTFGLPFRGRIDNGSITCAGVTHSISNNKGSIDGQLMQNIPHASKERHQSTPTVSGIDHIEGFAWKDRLLMGTSGVVPKGWDTINPVIVDDRNNPILLEVSTSFLSSYSVEVAIKAIRWAGRITRRAPQDEEFDITVPLTGGGGDSFVIDLSSEIAEWNLQNRNSWLDPITGISVVNSVVSPTWDKIALVVNLGVFWLVDPLSNITKYVSIGSIYELSFSGHLREYEGEPTTLEYTVSLVEDFASCTPSLEVIDSFDTKSYAKILVTTNSSWTSGPGGRNSSSVTDWYSESVEDPAQGYIAYSTSSYLNRTSVLMSFYYDEGGNRCPVWFVFESSGSSTGSTVFHGATYNSAENTTFNCAEEEECITYVPRTGCRCVKRCTVDGEITKTGNQSVSQIGSGLYESSYYFKFGSLIKGKVSRVETVSNSSNTFYQLNTVDPVPDNGDEIVYDPCDTAPTEDSSGGSSGTTDAGHDPFQNFVGGEGGTSRSYHRVVTVNGTEVYRNDSGESDPPSLDLNYTLNGWYNRFGLRIFGVSYSIDGYDSSHCDGGLHTDNHSIYAGPYANAAYDPYLKEIVTSNNPVSFI